MAAQLARMEYWQLEQLVMVLGARVAALEAELLHQSDHRADQTLTLMEQETEMGRLRSEYGLLCAELRRRGGNPEDIYRGR